MSRRKRRFALWFPAIVFGSLAVGLVIEHTRPSHSDLPIFDPPAKVSFEAIEIPRGEHTLEGIVRDSSGAPTEGVLVELVQREELFWDYTDERGTFRIDGLFEGELSIALIQVAHPPVKRTVSVPGGTVDWMLPEPYAAPESLPEIRRQALYGSVSSPLGAPVGGSELVLEPFENEDPLSGLLPRRAPIGNAGNFNVVDLAIGRYRVAVVPGWAAGGSWPRLAELSFEHGGELRDLEILLESGEVSGTLRDREGEAVQRALVTVTSVAKPERVWPPVRSDGEGSFSVRDLPEGEYDVAVRAGSAQRTRRVSVRARRSTRVELGPVEVGGDDVQDE